MSESLSAIDGVEGLASGITARGAEAIIPRRRNAKPRKKDSPGAEARNGALSAIEGLDRMRWCRWSGYHRRDRAGTKMECIEPLGRKFAARDFDRQTAGLPVRIAILDRFSAPGIPVTWPIGLH